MRIDYQALATPEDYADRAVILQACKDDPHAGIAGVERGTYACDNPGTWLAPVMKLIRARWPGDADAAGRFYRTALARFFHERPPDDEEGSPCSTRPPASS